MLAVQRNDRNPVEPSYVDGSTAFFWGGLSAKGGHVSRQRSTFWRDERLQFRFFDTQAADTSSAVFPSLAPARPTHLGA